MIARDLLRYATVGAFALAVWNLASFAMAAPPPMGVPEIDPTSAASALSVLAAGGLIVAERLGFRRK